MFFQSMTTKKQMETFNIGILYHVEVSLVISTFLFNCFHSMVYFIHLKVEYTNTLRYAFTLLHFFSVSLCVMWWLEFFLH
jgi:hypothetical protein